MAKSRVLVVDDDPQVRGVLRDTLKLADCESVLVGSGPDALSAVRQDRPDLVILDLGMPGMSGLEVLEQLQGLHPGLPTIVLSGMAHPEDTPDLMARGARAIVGKPFQARELLSVVERALGR